MHEDFQFMLGLAAVLLAIGLSGSSCSYLSRAGEARVIEAQAARTAADTAAKRSAPDAR